MSTYTPIATQTLSSASASVTFSGIPQNYSNLILVCNVAQSSGANSLRYRFNDDSSSNYSATHLYGNGSTVSSGRESSATSGYINTTGNTTLGAVFTLQVMNYSNTTTNKTAIGRGNNASVGTDATVGLWRSTSAINKISVAMGGSFPTNNFASGSTFTLYGIGSGSPKAFGGDEVRTDGTYWYHIYRSSGIFAPTQSLSCDYLVVAGGGGGGYQNGGGGGAGGFRTSAGTSGGNSSAESALSVTSGNNYTVTVGAGGAAGTVNDGGKGNDSVFATITSEGGGYGKGTTAGIGGSGGSGGGGSGNATASEFNGGTATSNQGSNGGKGGFRYAGGGGGGASAVGNNYVSNNPAQGGNGGNGLASSITGTSVTYAGGGGGALRLSTTYGNGGTGGGGRAEHQTDGTFATSGTANTGGGGGGRYSGGTAGAGGSGIVIVRYAI